MKRDDRRLELDSDKDMNQGLALFRWKPYWLPSLHFVAIGYSLGSKVIKVPQAENPVAGSRRGKAGMRLQQLYMLPGLCSLCTHTAVWLQVSSGLLQVQLSKATGAIPLGD